MAVSQRARRSNFLFVNTNLSYQREIRSRSLTPKLLKSYLPDQEPSSPVTSATHVAFSLVFLCGVYLFWRLAVLVTAGFFEQSRTMLWSMTLLCQHHRWGFVLPVCVCSAVDRSQYLEDARRVLYSRYPPSPWLKGILFLNRNNLVII